MKQNKTNESGRSMVEMLGVLAVIGVLSIGGIAGYKYAMRQILYHKIDDFTQKLGLALVSEQYKDTADDLRCNAEDRSYGPINYLCSQMGSEYCTGSRVSHNGYYWLDYGKEGPYFGWEVTSHSDVVTNHYKYGILVSLWFSDTDMCKHVMTNLGQNKDFAKMIRWFTPAAIGRGYNHNISGWGEYASWSESKINKICKPAATSYSGRESITVGLNTTEIETFECIDE